MYLQVHIKPRTYYGDQHQGGLEREIGFPRFDGVRDLCTTDCAEEVLDTKVRCLFSREG